MIDHLTEQAAQLLPPLSAARRDQLRKRAARYLPRDPLKLFNTRLADCQRAVAAIEDKGGIPTPGQIRRL